MKKIDKAKDKTYSLFPLKTFGEYETYRVINPKSLFCYCLVTTEKHFLTVPPLVLFWFCTFLLDFLSSTIPPFLLYKLEILEWKFYIQVCSSTEPLLGNIFMPMVVTLCFFHIPFLTSQSLSFSPSPSPMNFNTTYLLCYLVSAILLL